MKMKEVARRSIKVSGLKGNITTKAFLETMANYFYVQNEVKQISIIKPTFAKYTDIDEIYHKVTKLTIPDESRWEELVDLLD